jgi:hypothetical protein
VTFGGRGLILEAFPVIELKQDMFTVYETEEVSIKCNEIKNKKRNDQVFWEWIDENKKMTRRVKKGDGFDLETDPPCLKILDVQKINERRVIP